VAVTCPAMHAPVESLTDPCMLFASLDVAQHRLAQLFGVSPRSVRRWRDGKRRTPYGVQLVLNLLATEAISITELERAAVRINGGAKPVPHRIEPVPEQKALARAETATLADLGPTTAERVWELAAGCCCWPIGDPGASGFNFCGRPAVGGEPYCAAHRAAAHRRPATTQSAIHSKNWREAGHRPDIKALLVAR
jgi:hypothetical protein